MTQPVGQVNESGNSTSTAISPVIITNPSSDPETTLRAAAMDAVAVQAKEYINKILLYLLAAAVGATAAVIWDLNGQIYKAVGATEISGKIHDVEIDQLKRQINEMKEQMNLNECLQNKKVTDKARCYNVH